MKRNWRDISYLMQGNLRQRRAFHVLQELDIFSVLADFDPLLVSTVCIGVDVEGSDLDIICEAEEPEIFERRLKDTFGLYSGFALWRRDKSGRAGVVAQFRYKEFLLEIFGISCAVEKQNAYLHMLSCWRILQLGGQMVHQRVIKLREQGLKTEPAFARCLALKGDPYHAILELADLPDEQLRKIISAAA